MNLSDIRTLIRRDLHDEDSGNYRWSNDELDRHIARSVKEFSEAVPLEQKATMATTAGSREISVAALTGRVILEAIEYPVDKFPKQYRRFALWGDTVTLLDNIIPDGSNCCIYYGKLHTLDAGSSTIPAQYEDLVATGAAGYAALEWAVYTVNRVNTGGSQSPSDFHIWGKERLELFRAELKRLSRRNRARVRSLYQPHYQVVSKATDYGP
jgi:hypothetical protein